MKSLNSIKGMPWEKVSANLNRRYSRARFQVRRAFIILLQRAWAIELAVLLIATCGFSALWLLASITDHTVAQFTTLPWGILPVLAITNALPMLGASAFLARFSVIEKPSETLRSLAELVEEQHPRIGGHPRESSFVRAGSYARALNRAKAATYRFADEMGAYFTPRPYWDGIWFYGGERSKSMSDEPALQQLYSAHELIYCALMMLRVVAAVRSRKVWLISEPSGGSQGSIWFLQELTKRSELVKARLRDLAPDDAWQVVRLAVDSEHYMLEELRKHRDANTTDERTQTGFVHIMCDYLIWQSYFHGKLMRSRIMNVHHRRKHSVTQLLDRWYNKNAGAASKVKQDSFELRAANLPRREIAERILQVRRGTIIPLITTAVVLVIYLCLQPITYGAFAPEYPRVLSGIAYVLASASIVVNFTFGIWLLVPVRDTGGADLLY